jgi:hypothetical protein
MAGELELVHVGREADELLLLPGKPAEAVLDSSVQASCGTSSHAGQAGRARLGETHRVWLKNAALALGLAFLPACNTLKIALPLSDRADRVARDVPPLPTKKQYRISQFVFVSDFDIDIEEPLFQELAILADQVCRELQLPPANKVVTVYLFPDRDKYERFTMSRYPEVPRRRAFFVAQPRVPVGGEELLVFTYWGDHRREDLRHELTHAVLHSVLKDVPLWLDEGLAEYFEVDPADDGVNLQHLDYFRQVGPRNFDPDLIGLEQCNQLHQMTAREYRESWAWVHLMLRDGPEPKRVLVEYLKVLRTNASPGPLEPRLTAVLPNAPASLRRHLATIDREQAIAKP